MTTSTNLHSIEAQKFSENAAKAFVDGNCLVQFFRTLNYELKPYGQNYRAVCPVCRDSAIFICTSGSYHRIFWKCYDKSCPTNTGQTKQFVKNLLGLVRALVDGHSQVTAMKAIAAFLGAKCTYDVTNGKLPPPEDMPPVEPVTFSKRFRKPFTGLGNPPVENNDVVTNNKTLDNDEVADPVRRKFLSQFPETNVDDDPPPF